MFVFAKKLSQNVRGVRQRRTERALSFGDDAIAYDRFRPGYPDAVADVVLGHAQGQLNRALEIGAGTGKATKVFAARGIEIVAVEPDEDMRVVLERETQGLTVQVIDATFESLDLHRLGEVDLLFAAAAFHWTDPETRWDRAASVLRPDGVAAFFGAFTELVDDALATHVEDVAATVLERDSFDLGTGNDRGSPDWPASELRRHPEFTDIVQAAIPRQVTMTGRDYVAHLSTISAYRVLPAARRAAVLTRLLAELPETCVVTQDVVVHLARRR